MSTSTYTYPAVRETFCRVLGDSSVQSVALQAQPHFRAAVSEYLKKTSDARRSFGESRIAFR